jgi:hypothetical protein
MRNVGKKRKRKMSVGSRGHKEQFKEGEENKEECKEGDKPG